MRNCELRITLFLAAVVLGCSGPETTQVAERQETAIKIDSVSGLVIDENFELVRAQCTACHSARLVTQNSASREGWEQMIRWMQKDQGLWDLGQHETPILDYLSKHYGIKQQGRRKPLTDIEWYPLTE